MTTGAECLVKSLEDLGVKRIFGYTGGAIAPVYNALRNSSIQVTINSNEQSAVFSAAGYSRSTEQVGVAIVTSGPSITNGLTAIVDANNDSIPLLVISGQVPEPKIGTDAFQYVDVPKVFAPITKKTIQLRSENIQQIASHERLDNYSHIRDAQRLEEIIKKSYAETKSGKPGPIVIDIPVNIQNMDCPYTNLPTLNKNERWKFEENECEELFSHLIQSKRPLLYIGGGAANQETTNILRQLNATLQIPSVNTLMGKGILETDELNLGMLGMFGTPAANTAVQQNDFFLAIGVRWDDRVAEKVGSFGNFAKIAYIDINETKVKQINNERSPVFSRVCDAKTALESLATYARKNKIDLDIAHWRQEITLIKNKWKLAYNKSSTNIQQAQVIAALQSHINKNTYITTGVGNHQMFAAQYLKMPAPRHFITSASFGVMGFAVPTAIGVQYAHPDATVIAIDGDGGLKMNFGELCTMVEENIPIKILLLNNQGDGMVRNLQDSLYAGLDKNIGTVRKRDIHFAHIARECGFSYARRISEKDHIESALHELMRSNGPALLEVMTDPLEAVYPKIPSGKTYKEMILGPHIRPSF